MRNFYVGVLLISIVLLGACGQTNNTDTNNQEANDTNDNLVNNSMNSNNNEEDSDEENTNDNNEEAPSSVLDEADPSIVQLVNKENELGPDDHPSDLVTIDVPHVLDNDEVNQLREEASEALNEMFAAANEEDVDLFARSGFRSYQTQEQLFASYAEQNGMEAANRFSARPGQSEHQTGLVMDVTSEQVGFDLSEEFGETTDGKWLRDNAHQFGYIIRYPEGKEDITGYIYEPWHIRYLGKEVATAVYESGLTYEEFIEMEEGK